MPKFLISFPAAAMDLSEAEFAAAGQASRAVIREAKAAGVYVFAGGIDEDAAPAIVSGDGRVGCETYPQTRELDGGFCVLDLASREAALQWAAKIAAACRCAQEVRQFMHDPES